MNEKFGEIIPPARSSRTSLEHSNIRPPQVGGLVSKWLYHFQAQTLQKQEELYYALIGLIEAQERAIKAKMSLERTAVSLEFLDEFRQLEREKIRADMEWERATIRIKNDHMLAALAKSDADLYTAREQAEKIMNPPPPPPPPDRTPKPDPVKERIRTTLHGGQYAEHAEQQIQELIKQRGGEDKLTEEDRDRIRNTRLHAARADQGKS
jgi:hypothetical protein